jgi:hypothetical protein
MSLSAFVWRVAVLCTLLALLFLGQIIIFIVFTSVNFDSFRNDLEFFFSLIGVILIVFVIIDKVASDQVTS